MSCTAYPPSPLPPPPGGEGNLLSRFLTEAPKSANESGKPAVFRRGVPHRKPLGAPGGARETGLRLDATPIGVKSGPWRTRSWERPEPLSRDVEWPDKIDNTRRRRRLALRDRRMVVTS